MEAGRPEAQGRRNQRQRGPHEGNSQEEADYEEWSQLVYRRVRHMVDRYGTAEVAKWEWEV